MAESNNCDDLNKISSIGSEVSEDEEDGVVDDSDDVNSSVIDADDNGSHEQGCEPSTESIVAKDSSSNESNACTSRDANDGRADTDSSHLRSKDIDGNDVKDVPSVHEESVLNEQQTADAPKNTVSKKKDRSTKNGSNKVDYVADDETEPNEKHRAPRTKKRKDDSVAGSLAPGKADENYKADSVVKDETDIEAKSSDEIGKQNQLPPVPPKCKSSKKSGPKSHNINSSEVKRRVTAPSAEKFAPQMNSTGKRRSSDVPRMAVQKSSLFPRDDEDLVSRFLAFKEASYAPKVNTDLLSNFVTYQDTCASTVKVSTRPATASMVAALKEISKTDVKESKMRLATTMKASQRPLTDPKAQRPSTSPLLNFASVREDSRKPGLEKRKSAVDGKLPNTKVSIPKLPNYDVEDKSSNPLKSYEADDYDIPAKSLKQRRNSLSPRPIETEYHELGPFTEKPVSKPGFNNQVAKSNANRMILSTLSTAVKLFCFLCISARCITYLGAKRSMFHYIAESPAVWIIRLYILIFHAILILVEMKICIPGIIPRETLDNFVHRAFFQSFIGLLDMSMNSNKALVEHITDSSADSEMDTWIDISYAVLSVAPKGLIACSIVYFIFAVCGFSGKTSFNTSRMPMTLNGA